MIDKAWFKKIKPQPMTDKERTTLEEEIESLIITTREQFEEHDLKKSFSDAMSEMSGALAKNASVIDEAIFVLSGLPIEIMDKGRIEVAMGILMIASQKMKYNSIQFKGKRGQPKEYEKGRCFMDCHNLIEEFNLDIRTSYLARYIWKCATGDEVSSQCWNHIGKRSMPWAYGKKKGEISDNLTTALRDCTIAWDPLSGSQQLVMRAQKQVKRNEP